MPSLAASDSPLSFSIVEISEASAQSTEWTYGTVLYFNDQGQVVGYGKFDRLGESAVELRTRFDAAGVSLLYPSLSPSPQPGDA